jgi:hypothetical protein
MPTTTRNLLLTGAGFTHNFGAPLARGLWNKIYTAKAVRDQTILIELLHKNEPDFETVYQEVIDGDYSKDVKVAIRSAVNGAFSSIDQDLLFPYQLPDSPSIQHVTDLVKEFRPRHPDQRGYFFTLNQDLFVERHMLENAELHPLGIGGRPGFSGPYLGQRPLTRDELKALPEEAALPAVRRNAEAYCRFGYVKLHGSQDWLDSRGWGVMVLGRAKEDMIAGEPILKWYLDLFRAVLTDSAHRLVVIGYSFRDQHINRALAAAINDPGLDLVVISPTPNRDFEAGLVKQERGQEISRALRQPGSRYYEWRLKDVFPAGTWCSPGAEWDELKGLLRS